MKLIVSGIILLAIFAVGLAFSANNQLMVSVNYFIAQGQFQLVHLLAIAFLLGVLISLAGFLQIYFKLRIRNKRLRSQLKRIRREVSNPSQRDTGQHPEIKHSQSA